MLDSQELEMVKMQIVAPVSGSLAKPEEMGESLAWAPTNTHSGHWGGLGQWRARVRNLS